MVIDKGLDARNLKTNRPSKKLSQKAWGPFRVTKVYRNRAVRVDGLPPEIYPVFPVVYVRHYKKSDRPQTYQSEHEQRWTVTKQGEEPWVLEEVLGSKKKHGQIVYLMKWKGDDKIYEDPWENWHMLEQAVEMVKEYHVKEKKKRRPRPMDPRVDG